jgi:hypothetical protein
VAAWSLALSRQPGDEAGAWLFPYLPPARGFSLAVIPVETGIQFLLQTQGPWIPACAGMTEKTPSLQAAGNFLAAHPQIFLFLRLLLC